VDENTCRIDDLGPLPVVRPASVAEVGDTVRRAAAEGQAIYPLGGRTLLDLGLPPDRPGWALDLSQLTAVIDYPARDMTITVQAGIPIARLQALLATENQRLPIDVPRPEQATLGGSLATNVSGPRRHACGTLRDYVIGISTVNDEGQEVKAGGRVVKNVAGYDLCKLHIGALGTLGVITQVTLKLRPLPESRVLLTLGCTPDTLDDTLDRLHRTRTRPVCVDVLNHGAAGRLTRESGVGLPDAPWIVVVGFEDSTDAIDWQVQQLIKEISPVGALGLEARAGAAADPLWTVLAGWSSLADARLTFKANLLPSAVAPFCRQAAARAAVAACGRPRDGDSGSSLLLHAHAGAGIVRGHLTGDLTLDEARAMLKEFSASAERAQGNLVLPRCPVEWKRSLPIWGAPRGDLWLMRRVKEQLDPRRLFNPGRFVDGI
jgi:glycolate oxidase FAD binding subunit